MTTKYLTSDQLSGYGLKANYSKLVVDLGVFVGTGDTYGVSSSHTATVINYGTVGTIQSYVGVYLGAGGRVTNGSATDTTAVISGGYRTPYAHLAAVQAYGASTTLANFGTILGYSVGVELAAGGRVTNGSAADTIALIKAGLPVYGVATVATTVTNFGTIYGTVGFPLAVDFRSAADRLIVEKSAVFVGSIAGGGGTLELAGGSDTITGLGGAGKMTGATPTSFYGFGTYVVDSGAELTLTGANALTTGQSLSVAGTLVNSGTLTGPAASGYGVTLAGGRLTNGSATDTTALISGDRSGVYGTVGTTVTIGNFGTIQASSASNSVGVNLDANGSVTNGSAADTIALIKGGIGVYSYGSAVTTVTNFGAIDGTGGTAVAFHDAADRLIVESKAAFVGALAGGGGTLELAGGSDTITGLGGAGKMTGATAASFSGFGTYVVDTGAELTLTGANALTTGQSLSVAGALVNTGTLTGPAASGYGVTLAGGRLTNGSATDTTALIAGDRSGVYASAGATVTIGNFGTIQASSASNSVGVNLDANGSVTNGSAADTIALIKGGIGVYSYGSAVTTVTNFGAIDGTGGTAVAFHDAADRLIVESKAAFVGALAGGGGTLELAGGSDTITGLGGAGKMTGATAASFSGFGAYVVDTGVALTLTGNNALTTGQSLRVAGTLFNTGTLTGSATSVSGVTLTGGTLTNGSATDTTALISGDLSGVYATLDTTVTIGNFGTIHGESGVGVYLGDGGSVTNGSAANTTAVISSASDYGVAAYGTVATTITNFGTVSAAGAPAVKFGLATDRLIVESKAAFVGALVGGGGTLELAGGSDTITGLGGAGEMTGATSASFGGFGAYLVDTGADLTLTGANALTAGQSLTVAGALVNTGALTRPATSLAGVTLLGGTLTNGSATDTTALISGDRFGVYATVGPTVTTVTNFGTIHGESGVGLGDGGSVTNGSAADTTAVISSVSGEGVAAYGTVATTITNFGTISATGAPAVRFGLATDRLIVESKAVFVGALVGGGGTLELAGGSDTITGLGGAGEMTGATPASFYDFGAYIIDTGADLTLTGTNSLAGGQSLVVSGTLTDEGALTNAGAISGAGVLALNGGTATFEVGTSLTIAKITESGTATAATFAAPSLTDAKVWTQTTGTVSASSGDRVNFTGKGDTFDGTLTGAGTVALFGGSDTLTGTTLSAKSVIIQNGSTVTLAGTIDLTTTLTATTNNLIIGAGGATLSGGGVLSLTNTATNTVVGADSGATLTNDDTIKGAGRLGAGTMTLVNSAGALIDAVGTLALTINTGNNAITNAGTIQAGGPGGLTIASPLDNTGVLIANPGTLAVNRAVTGAGIVRINGGTADFASAFNENVDFTGPTGVLELSQAYSGAVTGLSKTGSNAIVLEEIDFADAPTWSYSGTTTSGVLTVKDSLGHTAKITLEGDYLGSTFVLSAGPGSGTKVVDPTAAPIAATQRFIAAAAGFAAPQAATTMAVDPDGWRAAPTLAVSKALV